MPVSVPFMLAGGNPGWTPREPVMFGTRRHWVAAAHLIRVVKIGWPTGKKRERKDVAYLEETQKSR